MPPLPHQGAGALPRRVAGSRYPPPMSDTRPDASESDRRPERRGPPPNPLYHPLFLPVLLVAFTLWFWYDGFIWSAQRKQVS